MIAEFKDVLEDVDKPRSDEGRKDDKYDSHRSKRDNRDHKRGNSHRKHHNKKFDNKKYDSKEHKKHDKEYRPSSRGRQTLDLEVMDGVKSYSYDLPKIYGHDLPEHKNTVIDIPADKVYANSAVSNTYVQYGRVDLDPQLLQAQNLDYMTFYYTVHPEYQSPHPMYNAEMNAQGWVWQGWDQHYTTVTTGKFEDAITQTVNVVNDMLTNDSFRNMDLLAYRVVAPAMDQNPCYTTQINEDMNGTAAAILCMCESVDMSLLYAVMQMKEYRIEKALCDYFTQKHPAFVAAIQAYRNRLDRKEIKFLLENIQDLIAQIPHNVEFVEKYSEMALELSRKNDGIASPVMIPLARAMIPAYQIATAEDGITFTPVVTNTNFNEDAAHAFYREGAFMTVNYQVITLIQACQEAMANNPMQVNFNQIATQQAQAYTNMLVTLRDNLVRYKVRLIAYNAFMAQTTAAGLTDRKCHRYEYDNDVKWHLNLNWYELFTHPEAKLINSANEMGQYPIEFALYQNEGMPRCIADVTPMYGLSADWIWNNYPNANDYYMPNYTPILAYEPVANPQQEQPAAVRATDVWGAIPEVYQLPQSSIYSYIRAYKLNGEYMRYYAWTQAQNIQCITYNPNGANIVYNLPINGLWMLSDYTVYSNITNTGWTLNHYQTEYGIGGTETLGICSGPWSSQILTLLGIVADGISYELGVNAPDITTYSQKEPVAIQLTATVNDTNLIIKQHNMERLPFPSKIRPKSITQVTQIVDGTYTRTTK